MIYLNAPTSYLTLASPATALLREKGSRFMAYAWPVSTEAEIREQLLVLRKEHPSANHHCYAWRLGADKQRYRVNDDGEPSGSAGRPILAAIQSCDLSNVLVVVVRYFGGTLLGVGGLISAYRGAALAALQTVGHEEQFVTEDYDLSFETTDTNTVMRVLKELEAKILANNYDEKNVITFRIKKLHTDQLLRKLSGLYTAVLKPLTTIRE